MTLLIFLQCYFSITGAAWLLCWYAFGEEARAAAELKRIDASRRQIPPEPPRTRPLTARTQAELYRLYSDESRQSKGTIVRISSVRATTPVKPPPLEMVLR